MRAAVTFGHPLLLLSLLLIPATVAAYLVNERRRARYAVRFTNLSVLEDVVGTSYPWRRWLTAAAFLFAIAALCVAVARPHMQTTVTDENATVVLVLDVSGSMHAVDVKPTRLIAAQRALHLFLNRIPKRLKVGLVLFAGEAQVATPPTTDHQLVSNAIDEANFFNGFGGTAIGDAINLAVQLGIRSAGITGTGPTTLAGGSQLASYVTAQPTKSTLVSILFLSDGKQNRGIIQPLDGAARARRAGVPVYTVALGTTGDTHLSGGFFGGGGGGGGGFPGAPGGGFGAGTLAPDPHTLSAIAKITGGEFFRARTAHALDDAYKALGSKLGQTHGTKEITDLFVLAAVILLVGAGILSALWAPRLP